MFIPSSFDMPDHEAKLQFIEQWSFAVLTSPDLQATHLPLLLARDEGQCGVLYGHMARANPQWQSAHGQRVVAVFSGPHSYISPTWYAAGPAVPTWNYVAVHAYGVLECLEAAQTLDVVQRLTAHYEPALAANTTLLAPDYVAKLNRAIVGFRIELDSLQGQAKLGQQRSVADQAGVFAALQQSAELDSQALAAYMQAHQLGTGQ